jgi:hypothetical protein
MSPVAGHLMYKTDERLLSRPSSALGSAALGAVALGAAALGSVVTISAVTIWSSTKTNSASTTAASAPTLPGGRPPASAREIEADAAEWQGPVTRVIRSRNGRGSIGKGNCVCVRAQYAAARLYGLFAS